MKSNFSENDQSNILTPEKLQPLVLRILKKKNFTRYATHVNWFEWLVDGTDGRNVGSTVSVSI